MNKWEDWVIVPEAPVLVEWHLCVEGHNFRGHSTSTMDQLSIIATVEFLQSKEGV